MLTKSTSHSCRRWRSERQSATKPRSVIESTNISPRAASGMSCHFGRNERGIFPAYPQLTNSRFSSAMYVRKISSLSRARSRIARSECCDEFANTDDPPPCCDASSSAVNSSVSPTDASRIVWWMAVVGRFSSTEASALWRHRGGWRHRR